MTRRCEGCHELKPLDEFHVDRSRKHGRKYVCKLCVKLRDRKVYNITREPRSNDGRSAIQD